MCNHNIKLSPAELHESADEKALVVEIWFLFNHKMSKCAIAEKLKIQRAQVSKVLKLTPNVES